jgi:hypothetical protein
MLSEFMRIDYEITPEDFVALSTVHCSRSPALRRQGYGFLMVPILGLFALPGLILVTTDEPILETAKNIWPLMLGPVLFVLFIVPYMRWKVASVASTTKRMLAEGQNAGLFGPRTLSIEPEGLRESKSTGDSMRIWSAVEKVLVTDTHAFIYLSAVEAYLLPRRAFKTSDAFQEFVDEVSRCAGVAQQTA